MDVYELVRKADGSADIQNNNFVFVNTYGMCISLLYILVLNEQAYS